MKDDTIQWPTPDVCNLMVQFHLDNQEFKRQFHCELIPDQREIALHDKLTAYYRMGDTDDNWFCSNDELQSKSLVSIDKLRARRNQQ